MCRGSDIQACSVLSPALQLCACMVAVCKLSMVLACSCAVLASPGCAGKEHRLLSEPPRVACDCWLRSALEPEPPGSAAGCRAFRCVLPAAILSTAGSRSVSITCKLQAA